MLLNDTVGHRQSQTCAAPDTFGGEEWIVDLGDVLGRNSDTSIANFDHQQTVVSISRRQSNATAAVGDRIARVKDKICKDLLELDRVGMNLRQIVRIVAHDLDLTAAQLRLEQLQSVVEHPMNIHSGKLGSAAGA